MARFSAVNVNQNESVNLTTVSKNFEVPTLSNIYVGLGWDVHREGADLDAFFVQLDDNDKLIDCIYFGHKRSDDRAIQLSEDNRTGDGDGDDEYAHINLSKLASNTKRVVVGVNIYQCSVSFNDVQNAFIRILDGDSKIDTPDELVLIKYNLSQEFGKNYSMIVGDIIKNEDGTWDFKAVGKGTKDRSIQDVVRSISKGKASAKPSTHTSSSSNDSTQPPKRKKWLGLF